MTLDFDEPLDRRASGSEKWSEAVLERVFGSSDVLPLWVADMDFRAPPEAVRALLECASSGDLGYRVQPADLRASILDWFALRHGWRMRAEELVLTPGVMTGVAAGIQLLSERGEGVIVQPPVFFEFDTFLRRNHREIVENPLRFENGRYAIDFDDLAAKASRRDVKLLILCNPHNPVGRAWSPHELERLCAICSEHGVHVISDDIHCDLAFAPARYTPAAAAGEVAISCFSPAKTFNVGGFTGGFVHIQDDALRERFIALLRTLGLMKNNGAAHAITAAVYRAGGPWLDATMDYLAANLRYARERMGALPGVELVEPDATFLVWLDFRAANVDARTLLIDRARLALSLGELFGTGGSGFARMCIACPRSILAEAFDRLDRALG